MAFEATKREWGELYAFFRLLADGYVYGGTPDVKKNEALRLPVAMVQREEHDGTRQYILEKDTVHLKGENIDKRIPREDFATVAELIYAAIRQSREDDVTSPDGVEEFLDEVAIFDLEAKTDDRTDFSVAFYSVDAPLTGFCVRSRLGMMIPLLDGGRTANFKFEQTGVKFATPTVNKINAEGEEDDVISRMLMIERLGGTLKYSDVADKIFRSNLSMIDLHMGRLMAEMTRLMWLDGITKVSELTEEIKKLNPLKIKDELITKHGFYEYKVKELLLALAMGLRPAKLYNGTDSAIAGFLFVTGDGEVLCYQRAFRQTFAIFEAFSLLSPVSITGFIPYSLTFEISSLAPSFTLSSSSNTTFKTPSSAYPKSVLSLLKSTFTPQEARYSIFPPTIFLSTSSHKIPFERSSFAPSSGNAFNPRYIATPSDTGCFEEATKEASRFLSYSLYTDSFTTLGFPSVSVPVLSSSRYSAFAIVSSIEEDLNIAPRFAAV
jgi:type II restriction enzyme